MHRTPCRAPVTLDVRLTMTKATLSKVTLVSAVVCIALAVTIIVYADGLRRWYSGGFFAIMGAAMLVSAMRWRHETDK